MPSGAEVCEGGVAIRMRESTPLRLHDDTWWRTDGNSPILVSATCSIAFFSQYQPRGHTRRRVGDRALHFAAPSVPVILLGDPAPRIGKWIEGIWRDPATSVLHGWYHAEEPVPGCNLVVPHIGEVESSDGGVTWRCRGEVLRASPDEADCSWRNGFFAGGYGDLCVVPDREGRHLYLAFTSYCAEERNQGVALARMPRLRSGPPATGLELWTALGWQPASGGRPEPLWPQTRGWRHADPDGFWGPVIHYNRALGAYVLLMTHTAGGHGDLCTEGIYCSIAPSLDDPMSWTLPRQLVRGGAWYPQVVDVDVCGGDSETSGSARLFMAGFSAWTIEFSPCDVRRRISRPLEPDAADFLRWFGEGKCPW